MGAYGGWRAGYGEGVTRGLGRVEIEIRRAGAEGLRHHLFEHVVHVLGPPVDARPVVGDAGHAHGAGRRDQDLVLRVKVELHVRGDLRTRESGEAGRERK